MSESTFPVDIKVNIENEDCLKHFHICRLLGDIYKSKNHDYGDSFHKTYEEFGPVALAIRLQDKVSRLSALTTSKERMVKDESICDTLMDIANYAILGIMEMDYEGVASHKFETEETSNIEHLWFKIAKDDPIGEVKKIHQKFWDYVIEHGKEPNIPCYFMEISPVCHIVSRCDECPIVWPFNGSHMRLCITNNGLYSRWREATGEEKTELARQIRDLPWKFEQEEDS